MPLGIPAQAIADFARDGYAVVSGLWSESELDGLQAEMEGLQRRAMAGELATRYAGDMFLAPFEGDRPPYVHYVNGVTEVSPTAQAAFNHAVVLGLVRRFLGDHAYFWGYNGHGARRLGADEELEPFNKNAAR